MPKKETTTAPAVVIPLAIMIRGAHPKDIVPSRQVSDALLIHATAASRRAMVKFFAGADRISADRLARNSAKIQHAPIADRL